jgi:hypothetical protein
MLSRLNRVLSRWYSASGPLLGHTGPLTDKQ